MKKIIYYFSFLVLTTSCSQTKTTIETKDTLIEVKIDTIATDSSTSKVMYLEDVLECIDLQGLEKKYGAKNIVKKDSIETGEGTFEITPEMGQKMTKEVEKKQIKR